LFQQADAETVGGAPELRHHGVQAGHGGGQCLRPPRVVAGAGDLSDHERDQQRTDCHADQADEHGHRQRAALVAPTDRPAAWAGFVPGVRRTDFVPTVSVH
jgi:hypothetical protein